MGYFDDLARERAQIQAEGPKLINVGLWGQAEEALVGWGLKKPFVGTVALVESLRTTYLWEGLPDPREEVPILVGLTRPGKSLSDGDWLYGVGRLPEILAAPDPVEARLNSAIYSVQPDIPANNANLAIIALSEIMPAYIKPIKAVE